MQDLTQTGRGVSWSWSFFFPPSSFSFFLLKLGYLTEEGKFHLPDSLHVPISQSQALLSTCMPMPISPSLCQGRKEDREKKPRACIPWLNTAQHFRPGGPLGAPCTIDLRPDTSAPTRGPGLPAGFARPPAGNQLHREHRGHFEQWSHPDDTPSQFALDT